MEEWTDGWMGGMDGWMTQRNEFLYSVGEQIPRKCFVALFMYAQNIYYPLVP